MNQPKEKLTKDSKEHLFTKTFSLMIKRNQKASNNQKKATSFLELFFDLGIVFVFALLAKNLPEYLGIAHLDSSLHVVPVNKHAAISTGFWVINFLFLWLAWRKYNKWFTINGGDTTVAHALTLLLLISISMQAAALNLDDKFFRTYGMVISIFTTQLIFALFYFISGYFNDNLKTDNIELKKALILFVTSLIGGVVYIVLGVYGALEPTITGKRVQYTSVHFAIMLYGLLILLVEGLFVFIGMHFSSEGENSKTIHPHMKERHHLLILITFGETVLFNLSSLSGSATAYAEIIPELVMNLTIVMIMWYTYKTFIYKVTYMQTRRNRIAYSLTHIIWIASALFAFSMLSSYASAVHGIAELKAKGLAVASDIQTSKDAIYPLLYLIGLSIFFITILVFLVSTKFSKNKYGQAVDQTFWATFIMSGIVLLNWAILITLLIIGIEINLIWILLPTSITLLLFAIGITYFTASKMLEITDSIEEAAIEFEKLDS